MRNEDVDWDGLQKTYFESMWVWGDNKASSDEAARLGVSISDLKSLGAGYHSGYRAITYPMKDAGGRIVGIRIVRANGDGRSSKFAVKGSRNGLFYPSTISGMPYYPPGRSYWIIAEGESDVLAAMYAGIPYVVGIPGCTSAVGQLAKFMRRMVGKTRDDGPRIVIMLDADPAGQAGAAKIAGRMGEFGRQAIVLPPPEPFKDIRQWVNAGAGQRSIIEHIESMKHETRR